MKKLILIILVLTSIGLNAQDDFNNKIVIGTHFNGYFSSKRNGVDSTTQEPISLFTKNYHFRPSIELRKNEKWAFGMFFQIGASNFERLNHHRDSLSQQNKYLVKTKNYGLGLNLKYFIIRKRKFHFHIHWSIFGQNVIHSEKRDIYSTLSDQNIGILSGGGVDYLISEHFKLTAYVDLIDIHAKQSKTNFGLSEILISEMKLFRGLYIGIQYQFGKKGKIDIKN